MYRILRAAWPMLAWMLFVFLMSTDIGSVGHTGRFLVPLLRWFDPAIGLETIEHVHTVLRKLGHVTEYAVLAVLVLRALRILRTGSLSRWSWPLAFLALGVSAAYGASDEIHQLFVESRGPSVTDVLIDSTGALLGVLLAFAWWRRHPDSRTAPAVA